MISRLGRSRISKPLYSSGCSRPPAASSVAPLLRPYIYPRRGLVKRAAYWCHLFLRGLFGASTIVQCRHALLYCPFQQLHVSGAFPRVSELVYADKVRRTLGASLPKACLATVCCHRLACGPLLSIIHDHQVRLQLLTSNTSWSQLYRTTSIVSFLNICTLPDSIAGAESPQSDSPNSKAHVTRFCAWGNMSSCSFVAVVSSAMSLRASVPFNPPIRRRHAGWIHVSIARHACIGISTDQRAVHAFKTVLQALYWDERSCAVCTLSKASGHACQYCSSKPYELSCLAHLAGAHTR